MLLGFAWYGVPDHLRSIHRRWPRAWATVASLGGPVVAVVVPVLVLAGLGALVLAVAAIAFLGMIVDYWGPFSRYERELRGDRTPLNRDARLGRLARRYKTGELTSGEYEENTGDIRRRY